MLAKLVAWGETREAAIERSIQALERFPVLGVRTNIEFLGRTLSHAQAKQRMARWLK